MRYLKAILPLALVLGAGAAVTPELAQVQSVYILPMSNGVDQYLANKLTRMGVFRVVTDPKLADAVFTENVGPGFADRMEELYPTPKPEEKAEKPKEAPDKEAKNKAEAPPASTFGDLKGAEEPRDIFRPKMSSWARGKGNLFLVNRQSRAVIWSVFDKPRDNRPETLNHVAESVVKKLKGDLGRK